MLDSEFKAACEQADTPFLIEIGRQQANNHVKNGHETIAIFLRELCNRLEQAEKTIKDLSKS